MKKYDLSCIKSAISGKFITISSHHQNVFWILNCIHIPEVFIKIVYFMDEHVLNASSAGSPFHQPFVHHNSNLMEISFCCHPYCHKVIVMQFCTWHNNCAVVTCAQFCSNMIPHNGVRLKSIFNQILILVEKNAWNGLLVSHIYIHIPNLVLTLPADILAPSGARPSADTVLTEKLNFLFKFLWLLVFP